MATSTTAVPPEQIDVSRSTGPRRSDRGSWQRSIARQRPTESATEVWLTRTNPLRFTPPANGTFSSAVPWIAITETGATGEVHGTSRSPATGPIPASTTRPSHAMRYAIIAPFDIPVTKTRLGSMPSRRSASRMTSVTNATSSTFRSCAGPQQRPAFHERP